MTSLISSIPDPDTEPAPTPDDAIATDTGSTDAGTRTPSRTPKSFADVGVHPDLVTALTAKGFHHPFPIQELTLPLAVQGHDVIGQARTGTGKTLAFGLALLTRIVPGGGTQALVVVPTRELCIQVAEELQIGRGRGLRVIAVYGGVGYEEQEAAFRGGHEVVVGTPGRLLDHVEKGNLRLHGVTELVLDEADEMLDMGFLPDVERLIEACSSDRHGMLFSATMPTEVVKLARRYLDHPTFMRADAEPLETAPNVEQHFFQVHRMDKPRVLARILQAPGRGGVYVFVRTKHMADRLVRELEELDTPAIAIHGDLRQATREKNLDRFRDGSATVLVATEVAARGLDVEGVTHVVNYDCPDDEKMYLHRIGRTARAGAKGVAVTFAEFNEVDRLNVVRKKLGLTDNAIVPVFSPSEVLTERFDLPTDRPWDAQVTASRAGARTDRRAPDDAARERGAGDRGRGGRGGRRPEGGRTDREASSDAGNDGPRPAPRKGRSDGRPKSPRSAEGSGHDRDADRDRRRRPARADRDTTAPPVGGDTMAPLDSGDTTAPPVGGDTTAPPDRGDTTTAGAERVRVRTRDRGEARARTDRDGSTTADDDRTPTRPSRGRTTGDPADGADASPRTRARARRPADDEATTTARRAGGTPRDLDGDRDAGTAGRRRGRDTDPSREPAHEERPARGRDGSRSGRDGERDRDGGRDRGGERRTARSRDAEPRDRRTNGGRDEGTRSPRDRRSRDERGSGDDRGGERGRDGRGDDRGGERGRDGRGDERGRDRRDGGRTAATSRGGRGGRTDGRTQRDGRGRQDASRSRRDGGRHDDPTVKPARRGVDARGEGQPALARRVRVEHLP